MLSHIYFSALIANNQFILAFIVFKESPFLVSYSNAYIHDSFLRECQLLYFELLHHVIQLKLIYIAKTKTQEVSLQIM